MIIRALIQIWIDRVTEPLSEMNWILHVQCILLGLVYCSTHAPEKSSETKANPKYELAEAKSSFYRILGLSLVELSLEYSGYFTHAVESYTEAVEESVLYENEPNPVECMACTKTSMLSAYETPIWMLSPLVLIFLKLVLHANIAHYALNCSGLVETNHLKKWLRRLLTSKFYIMGVLVFALLASLPQATPILFAFLAYFKMIDVALIIPLTCILPFLAIFANFIQ